MLIPLIPKNPQNTDFSCRDGEIDFIIELRASGAADSMTPSPDAATDSSHEISGKPSLPNSSLIINHLSLERTIRIPLQNGDKPKAELLLNGEISRVDPSTADRLTQAMVQKAAEALLDLSTDLRRQGLFILPFRFYTMVRLPDGALSYPSPQAVALPTDYPPHPEIAAASVTDDCMTLALRFPVSPHRLTITPSSELPAGCARPVRTFISYPLYIPDPKEMRGSIGSVRSLKGGNSTGIRFAFLSISAMKASVAAPEKYYELVGNERTGYRLSSKAAPAPDYSCYASVYGYVPPFRRESLLALGEKVDADTDPLDWIADWYTAEEGYLPASLPCKYCQSDSDPSWPAGIEAGFVRETAESFGLPYVLLTRPMTFASDAVSRRHAVHRGIRSIRLLGLPPASPALGILYGSDDGIIWTPLRRFDPRVRTSVVTPPRLFWRVLLCSSLIFQPPLAIEVQ